MAEKLEKVESKYIKGNLVFDYVGDYNKAVIYFNKFNFNKDGSPKANAQASEPLELLKYNDVVKLLNKMSIEDQELVEQINKKAWKAYYDTVRDELYPKMDEILKIDLDR